MIKIFNTITTNHNETENLGFKFSKQISQGDIITLNGYLGSGKTTFVKGVLKGLSYTQEVTSPTYTLINEYNALYNIIHIDCYREKKIDRWLNIGLMDYFETDSIFFIEWAENIKDLLPNKTIDLFFHILDSNQRLIKYNE